MTIMDVINFVLGVELKFLCYPFFRDYKEVVNDILENNGCVVTPQSKIEFVQNIIQSERASESARFVGETQQQRISGDFLAEKRRLREMTNMKTKIVYGSEAGWNGFSVL